MITSDMHADSMTTYTKFLIANEATELRREVASAAEL